MSWTEDEIATLKRMVAQGDTYSRIQRHIPNKTRNACIGKALRLGLIKGPSSAGGRPRKDPDIAPLMEKAVRDAQPVATREEKPRPASFKGHKFMMLPDDKPELPQVLEVSPVSRPGPVPLTKVEPVCIIEETDETITIAMDNPQWEDMNGNPIAEDRAPGGVTLNDRKSHQCCWPINDGSPYRFCGAKKNVGSNYCPTHHKLMYKKGRAHDGKWIPPKVSAFKFRKA